MRSYRETALVAPSNNRQSMLQFKRSLASGFAEKRKLTTTRLFDPENFAKAEES
jgi:hypothetical protein